MAKKIKNPEKYIEVLKAQRARFRANWIATENQLEREKRKFNPYKGECNADWRQGIIDQQSSSSHALGVFNPGDMIVVTGIVTEVHKDSNGSELKFERKQTKLVTAIE